ncbi:hypothetical protein [Turicibacter bilis]|uniref:hypothetical protein n=1 Tax=Turicibacter bilis TaxID=2735723 RepID=UPI001BAE66D4|nr:hypothetical protein [Turicibacter bilis]MBS3198969.1 hypothetical protein [Turicibacter bilis]
MLIYYPYSGDLFPIYYCFTDYPVKRDKFKQVKKGQLMFDFERQGFIDEFKNFHSRIKIFKSSLFDEALQECSVTLDYSPMQKFPNGLEFYCYFGDILGLYRSSHPNNHGVYEVGDLLHSNVYRVEIKSMGDPFIPHDFISDRTGRKVLNNQLWIAHAEDGGCIKEVWLSMKKEDDRLFLVFDYITNQALRCLS